MNTRYRYSDNPLTPNGFFAVKFCSLAIFIPFSEYCLEQTIEHNLFQFIYLTVHMDRQFRTSADMNDTKNYLHILYMHSYNTLCRVSALYYNITKHFIVWQCSSLILLFCCNICYLIRCWLKPILVGVARYFSDIICFL